MKKILLALVLIFIPTLVFAQTNNRNPCVYPNLNSLNCIPVTTSTPLPITGSITTSPSGTQTVSGTIGIDQTTPGTTNAIVNSPTSNTAVGIVPLVTSVAASNLVLKSGSGNLYGVELTSAASAGYLMLFNATSAPADGVVTPLYCKAVAANSSIELSWTSGPPVAFSTGMVAVFSTTGCFTKTASSTAFISGMVK